MEINKEIIKKLPKGDVHNHLILGVNRKSLEKYYSFSALKIPEYFNGLEGMIEYIHKEINKRMNTDKHVIKFMELAIADSIEDNVVLLEASIDINLVKYFNNGIEELIEAVHVLKSMYGNKIEFRPEIGINKNVELEKAYKYAIQCIKSGEFFGIDLYGPEKNMKLDGFIELFNLAKSDGLKTKVHIGEFSDYHSIDNAIDLLNPDEIQHGVNAVFSEKTMKTILAKDIRLNICPQSNVSLGSVKTIEKHPIRKLYDYGINITINTDDLLLFDATITDQYISLIENNVFSFEEIDKIRQNSLNYKGM